ncbi:MAG: PP2C family protein-serine/threonine phosphatase [Bacteroidetes bacterium]|nr:PP2C family protein-serine/threonine phosphatase [Bacteroidota bacterium]
MPETQQQKPPLERATHFTQRVMDDLRDAQLPQTIRRDLKDTYEFYVDDETQRRLETMGTFKRTIYLSGYLIRSLFLKLAPTRRLLLLVGVVLTFIGMPDEEFQIIFGLLSVLFVLGLELKDKLLAKDELAEGRSVQIALMPSENPKLPGWETWLYTAPANDVGGDLVDHLRIDEDRIALTLGDVAGKGLPAALMMAKLQATLRALAPITGSLSDLGRQLNEIVVRDGLPSKFASLVFLELSANSGMIRLLNAGHLPPLVLRDNRIEELDHGDPAIGLTTEARFKERIVHLDPGDMMLVYSDGLTEARNEIGRFFGEERLKELLERLRDHSTEIAGDTLLKAVERFEQGARRHDDLSIILIRRLKEKEEISDL